MTRASFAKMMFRKSFFLLAFLVFSAWARDYAVCAGGGGVMSIGLDKPAMVTAVNLFGKAEVEGVQTWDGKLLKTQDAATRISPLADGTGKRVELVTPCQTSGLILTGRMLQWKHLAGVTVFTVDGERQVSLAAPVNDERKLLPEPMTDLATVLNGKIFFAGPDKKERLTLGSPNHLNRRDRAVIRLNLLDYVGRESVGCASLHLRFSPYQANYPRQVEVELLNEEQRSITVDTGFGFTVTPLASLLLPFGPKIGSFEMSLDVTEAVNQALWKGHSSVAFRFRDCHCDQFGNQFRKPYAIAIDLSQVWFSIQGK